MEYERHPEDENLIVLNEERWELLCQALSLYGRGFSAKNVAIWLSIKLKRKVSSGYIQRIITRYKKKALSKATAKRRAHNTLKYLDLKSNYENLLAGKYDGES